jgi:hypothetical protein
MLQRGMGRESDMQIIYLESSQVPPALRRADTRKYRVEVREYITIPATAGLWDGGSRDVFTICRLQDGAAVRFPGQDEAPWGARADRRIELQPGLCVVEDSIFCGKDMGRRIYIHPANAAGMLPAPVELSAIERMVLEYTATRKSSYMGRNRFQMACDDALWNKTEAPTQAAWNDAVAALQGRGMLDKRGAITTTGRNAGGK